MGYIICFISFKLATSCIGQIPPLHSTGHRWPTLVVIIMSDRGWSVGHSFSRYSAPVGWWPYNVRNNSGYCNSDNRSAPNRFHPPRPLPGSQPFHPQSQACN